MNETIALLMGLTHWYPPSSKDPRKIWRDEYSRIAAAKQLGEVENTNQRFPVLGTLIRAAMSDEDEQVRYAAIETLTEIGPDDVVISVLFAMIFDEHAWIRDYAFGLLKSRSEEIFIQAAVYLQSDKDEDLRKWAIEVVENSDQKPGFRDD
ncbi:MAG: HEAT repeat domain-containing protein [bacterium]|nr:HEAT repeat domain-containing protein [bacterium]